MMEKMDMRTPNLADENFKKLAALFPEAVTETVDEDGEVVRAIDKDVLMQLISTKVVEGREERYQFTWPDKKKAMLAANAPIAATLRPIRADSVGKDGTPGGFDSENLYIEGDNLDVLKLLQETYLGKVKMIYIDPPYNTGSDFVYEDDFAEDADAYLARSGQFDEQGNRLEQNTESNGRFHTDWLNMIYPRLKLAKTLLSDTGFILVSIDDQEVERLRMMLNEVYGETNFIAQFIWKSKPQGGNDNKYVISEHEYILMYAKSAENITVFGKEHGSEKYTKSDEFVSERGQYATAKLDLATLGYRINLDYPVLCPDGTYLYPGNVSKEEWERRKAGGNLSRDWQWRWSEDKLKRAMHMGMVEFKKNGDRWNLYSKEYERMDYDGNVISRTIKDRTIIENITTINGTTECAEILGQRVFSYPKPVDLIKQFCRMGTSNNDVLLDFFSGSATTAHAVMQLNAEDGGNRKFIMVQLPEKTDEKSEARKAGYSNICEIGKERIRRAAQKIRDTAGLSLPKDFDGGFRCLRLDSSNMQDVYYNPAAMTQDLLSFTTDNIKPDRTGEDLLFQVMLDLGIDLSSPIAETELAGHKVYDVTEGFLLACFDAGATTETVTAIAKQQPYYAVFRDSSMADDSTATNFDQIFETYSPATVRKVL